MKGATHRGRVSILHKYADKETGASPESGIFMKVQQCPSTT